MSTELMKASDLIMPGSSGVLNIPLIEYDELRSKCKKAIDVARELESKQKYIKVVFQETQSMHRADLDGWGRARMVIDNKVIERIEYKNLDDFRDIITQEEEAKVAKRVGELDKKIIELKNNNNSLTEIIKKKEASILEQKKIISELQKEEVSIKKDLLETRVEIQKLETHAERKEEEISRLNKSIEIYNARLNKYQSISGLQLFLRKIFKNK